VSWTRHACSPAYRVGVTATTEAGNLPTVSTAPPALQEQTVVPGVAVTLTVEGLPPQPGRWAGGWSNAGRWAGRLRRVAARGLTAPGGIVLAALVIAPGVAVDLVRSGTFGTPSAVTFVLAGLLAALAVRVRALGTAAILPPLLFIGAVATLAHFGGKNRGLREVMLDVGTTLALSAPLVFATTAAALAVVLVRLGLHLAHRRR